jgi:citronellol/citronellal dehydrogenase
MDEYRSPLRPDANAGRVALVAGGGTGIGRATAVELAASGARVAICGRREEPLARVRAEIEVAGGDCLAVSADLREPEGVERVVGAALERFGALDVLVNNAGGQFTAPAEEITEKGTSPPDWRSSGAGTASAASASRRGRSSPRVWTATTARRSTAGRAACRSAGLVAPRRSRA